MSDIKYLGVQGLEELIILTQNALAKKADVLQFDTMPDPTKYIGKIVQYVGVSDISFTRSHFYYSNGIKWTEENISGEQTPKIEMVTALPSWVDADPQALYILKNAADITMNFYVKNPSVNGAWFTVEKSVSFVVVAYLPQWADADSSIIYFKASGNDLVGYIKNTNTTDVWYTFGEKTQIIIDAAISAISENPVQNKVIFTEIQDLRAQANMILTASQDADKKLHDDIAANSNALGILGTEVSGIHDDITACQDADGQLRKDIGTHSTEISRIDGEIRGLCKESDVHQYVQNQNLLYDFENIAISGHANSPTRMEYDGYVTVIENGTDAGVQLYINGKDVCYASRHHPVTVSVAKNDGLHLLNPTSGTVAYARFYKLRDYTGR